MDLDAQVDLVADRLAKLPNGVDRVAHLGDVGLEVGLLARLVRERRQVPDGGEAARLRVDGSPRPASPRVVPSTW